MATEREPLLPPEARRLNEMEEGIPEDQQESKGSGIGKLFRSGYGVVKGVGQGAVGAVGAVGTGVLNVGGAIGQGVLDVGGRVTGGVVSIGEMIGLADEESEDVHVEEMPEWMVGRTAVRGGVEDLLNGG